MIPLLSYFDIKISLSVYSLSVRLTKSGKACGINLCRYLVGIGGSLIDPKQAFREIHIRMDSEIMDVLEGLALVAHETPEVYTQHLILREITRIDKELQAIL